MISPAVSPPPSRSLSLYGVELLVAGLWMAPWLSPFASGPSAAFVPIAVAWGAGALLLAASPWRGAPAAWLAVALAVLIGLRGPWELASLGAAGSGLGLVLLGTGLGAAAVRGHARAGELAVGALLAAALVSAALALLQFFQFDAAFGQWVNHSAAGEAYANLRQRNHLATLMSLGLAALAWRVARGELRRSAGWMLALLMAGSAASSSRTGVVQIVLLAALAWCWRASMPARARWLLTAAAPVYVLVWWLQSLGAQALGGAFMRFAEGGAGCSSRLVLWHNVLDLIAARPWIGWGWGELDYAHYVSLYPGARFCAILDNAHNLPLHLAVELGLPVAIGLSAVVVTAGLRARFWREACGLRQLAWMVAAAIGLHSLLEYPLWYGSFELVFGWALGVLWPGRAGGRALRPEAVPRAAVAWAVIAGLAWICIDYRRMGELYRAPEARSAAYQGDTEARVARDVWFFTPQVRFAELTTRAIGTANAADSLVRSHALLHFSPEPRVIEQVLVAAAVLGRDDVLAFHWPRFRAAFADEADAFAASAGWALAQRLRRPDPAPTPQR